MGSFPEELLWFIAKHLWYQDIQGLLAFLRCNKQFCRIGSQILYKHIRLRRSFQSNAIPWLSIYNKTFPFIDGHVQSLTITRTDALAKHTGRKLPICQLLPKLDKLKTFSVNTTLDLGMEMLDYADVTGPLTQLLLAIPRTVVNLEVMLSNVLLTSDPDHLCEALASLIPQLETLRILLPTLCEDFLKGIRASTSAAGGTIISNLRYVSVWTTLQGTHPNSNPPFILDGLRYDIVTSRCNVCTDIRPDSDLPLDTSSLSRAVQDLHRVGHLPKLQHFLITQMTESKDPYVREWKVREAVSNSTLTVFCRKSLGKRHQRDKMIMRDSKGTDHYVDRAEFATFVEPAVWATLPNGSRALHGSEALSTFEDVCQNLAPTQGGKRKLDIDGLPRNNLSRGV